MNKNQASNQPFLYQKLPKNLLNSQKYLILPIMTFKLSMSSPMTRLARHLIKLRLMRSMPHGPVANQLKH